MHVDVVIVDQDAELAKLYCRFLANHGLTAEAATRRRECLELVRLQAPDVLVLDHELPRGDAKGILACLREDRLPLPIILTTWNAPPKTIQRLVVPPIVLCLRKFFPLPALLEGIRFAVNSYGSQEETRDVTGNCYQRAFGAGSERVSFS